MRLRRKSESVVSLANVAFINPGAVFLFLKGSAQCAMRRWFFWMNTVGCCKMLELSLMKSIWPEILKVGPIERPRRGRHFPPLTEGFICGLAYGQWAEGIVL